MSYKIIKSKELIRHQGNRKLTKNPTQTHSKIDRFFFGFFHFVPFCGKLK